MSFPFILTGVVYMNMVFRIWFVCIICINSISATDYYISQTGNDSAADGSISSPFRTCAEAVKHAAPGDTYYLREGIYREVLKPTRSGTQSAPISFKAFPGEKVVISACDSSTVWEYFSENVFVADVPDSVTQIFIDDIPARQASFPNMSSNNPFKFSTFPISSMTVSEVISPALDQSTDSWKGGTIWAMLGHRWISQVAEITGSTAGNLTITGNTWEENSGEGIGYITGCMAALDTAGEWHFEDGKLYVQLAPSDHPSKHRIEIKKRKWVIDLSGRSYINITGISTTGGAVSMNKSSYCTLDSMNMSYLSHFVQITSGGSSWLRHDWTDINYDGVGVGMFGSSNTIKNSEIAWSAGDGVTMYGSKNRVENCVIHDCNYSGTDCNPVSAHGADHVITRSTVYNGGRGIIGFFHTQRVMITYNDCFNPGLLNWDVGIIYAFGTDALGAVVAYNWVHDNISEEGYKIGNGIYIDNFCSDITVHHNVIWNCSYSAFSYSRPAKNIFYYNNTAFNAPDVNLSYLYTGATDTSSGNRLYNNLCAFSFKEFPMLDQSHNLFYETLPLRDTAQYDFRLTDDAAGAIDSGMVIAGITDGFLGNGPDIGAYEHGGVFWKAGAGTIDTVPLKTVHFNSPPKYNATFIEYKQVCGVLTFDFRREFTGSILLVTLQGKVAYTLYRGKKTSGIVRCPLKSLRISNGVYLIRVITDQKDVLHSGLFKLML
jgi:hypothetical protein